MPRKNTNEEVFRDIDEAGYIMDATGGLSTTLSAAAAKGATTVTVTSATGAAAGDLIRVGSGNQLEEHIIASSYTTGTSIPLRSPLAYAHVSGEAVVERTKVKIGEVTPAGVRVVPTVNASKVKTATTKGTYVTLYTDADHMISWATVNHSLENLAFVHGIAETAITGSGTVASPRRLFIGTDNLMALQNISVYCLGNTYDGLTQEIQGWNADLTPAGERTYLSGGSEGVPVGVEASVRAVVHFEYT